MFQQTSKDLPTAIVTVALCLLYIVFTELLVLGFLVHIKCLKYICRKRFENDFLK